MTEPAKEPYTLEGLSFSALSDMKKSARRFWIRRVDPKRPAKVTTDAMRFGKLFHLLTLEPHLYDEQFATKPKPEDYPDALNTLDQIKAVCKHLGVSSSKTKPKLEAILRLDYPQYKLFSDILADWEEKNKGKDVVTETERLSAQELADDVHAHPHARFFLSRQSAKREIKTKWTNALGIPMRGITDWLDHVPEAEGLQMPNGTKIYGNVLVELKTFSNPYEKPIDRIVVDKFSNELQFMQLAIYGESSEAIYGMKIDWFVTIYAESGGDRHIIIRANKEGSLPITQGKMLYEEMCRKFLRYHEQFGLEKPWVDDAQLVREFQDEEFPIWIYS